MFNLNFYYDICYHWLINFYPVNLIRDYDYLYIIIKLKTETIDFTFLKRRITVDEKIFYAIKIDDNIINSIINKDFSFIKIALKKAFINYNKYKMNTDFIKE